MAKTPAFEMSVVIAQQVVPATHTLKSQPEGQPASTNVHTCPMPDRSWPTERSTCGELVS